MDIPEKILYALFIIVIILFIIRLCVCSDIFKSFYDPFESPKNYSVLYLPRNFDIQTYLPLKKREIKSSMVIKNYFGYAFKFETNFVFNYTQNLHSSIILLFPKMNANTLTNFFIYYCFLHRNFKSFFYMLDMINLVILDKANVDILKTKYQPLIDYYNLLIGSFYTFTTENRIKNKNILTLLDTDFNKPYTEKEYKEFEDLIKTEKVTIYKKDHMPFFISMVKVINIIKSLKTIKKSLPKISVIYEYTPKVFIDNNGYYFLSSLYRYSNLYNPLIFEFNSYFTNKRMLYSIETFNPNPNQEMINELKNKIDKQEIFRNSDMLGSLKNPELPGTKRSPENGYGYDDF